MHLKNIILKTEYGRRNQGLLLRIIAIKVCRIQLPYCSYFESSSLNTSWESSLITNIHLAKVLRVSKQVPNTYYWIRSNLNNYNKFRLPNHSIFSFKYIVRFMNFDNILPIKFVPNCLIYSHKLAQKLILQKWCYMLTYISEFWPV